MTSPPPESAPPVPLRVAGGVLLVQGLGLAIAGAVVLVGALVGHPHDRPTAAFLGGLTIFYAAVVAYCGRGLLGGRTWAGTPALMVEFFALVIGVGQVRTLTAVSVVLLVSAVAAVAAMLHPQSREALIRRR